MSTKELFSCKEKFLEYLKNSYRCENTLWMNNYVINQFENYCLSKQIINIESEVIESFFLESLDYINKSKRYKTVLKRPVLALIDFYNYGTIKDFYHKMKTYEAKNENHQKILGEYNKKIIQNQNISDRSKIRKLRVIINFLDYFSNYTNLKNVKKSDIINYISTLYKKKLNQKTINLYCNILKEFLKYLYENNIILFSCEMLINSKKNNNITASSFKKEEIKTILESMNDDRKNSKHNYLVMTLLIYYGMRIGDITKLKFKNIDFNKNLISIIQSKTQVNLTLPLIDEVKYALLDYIKNERPNNIENEYILITTKAPFSNYKNNSCLNSIINLIIKNSKIELKDRKMGSRVFRHSLATNMINDGVELYKISNILGHKDINTVNNYISRDITNLSKITLEVL